MYRKLDLLPEILAGLSLLPCGIFMGYLMYFFQLSNLTLNIYVNVKYWPYVLAVGFSFLTGASMTTIKIYYKKYIFYHFYYLIIGNLIMFLSGLLFIIKSEYPISAIFIGAIGHGIIYIPAITYINLRANKNNLRTFKISLCHIWYLIGVALVSHFMISKYDYETDYFHHDQINDIVGKIMVTVTGIYLGGLILNELLNYTLETYDYKKSLDNDFERENNSEEIFLNKKFTIEINQRYGFIANTVLPTIPIQTITPSSIQTQQQQQHHQTTTVKESICVKEVLLIIFSLLSKSRNIWLFYFPFIYLNLFVTINITLNMTFYIAQWLAVVGIVITTFWLVRTSTKVIFILSTVIQIGGIISLALFFNSYPSNELHVMFLIFFILMGVGYSIPDINLVELTNLKYNEIIFSFGYLIEILPIGLIQYYSIVYPEKMYNGYYNIDIIQPHAIAMGVLLGILIIIAIFLMPITLRKTLLEIKNIISNRQQQEQPTYYNFNQNTNYDINQCQFQSQLNHYPQQQLQQQQQQISQINQYPYPVHQTTSQQQLPQINQYPYPDYPPKYSLATQSTQ